MTKILNAIDKHIGARVRMRRLQIGMTQEALAGAIDLTFQQVQKYEKGSNRISGSRMSQIAEALKVEPAFLFEGVMVNGVIDPTAGVSSMEFLNSPTGLAIVNAWPKLTPGMQRTLAAFVKSAAEYRSAR